MREFKVIISGAGPAGLAAAALLAQEGLSVAIIAPPEMPDPRTTALMQPALNLLRYIKIWPGEIADHSSALKQLHILDDTGNYTTAPDLAFSARELGLSEFGFNVPLSYLVPQLRARAVALGVSFIEGLSETTIATEEYITVTGAGETLRGKILLIADGAQSALRQQLGYRVDLRKFDQTALATSFEHSGPHENVSTEYHRPNGPFTLVPLPGRRSSLVWMGKPSEIEALARLSDDDLACEIQLTSKGLLGKIFNLGPRKSFAMLSQSAHTLAQNRSFLIGEAGHALPPIGAQGLNLSLRDVATAADILVGATDPGSPDTCAEYDRLRRQDVSPRVMITSILNDSLLSEFSGRHLARVIGLSAISKIPPLRQLALKNGLYPIGPLPFAMR